jgi:sugar lactone lactonase YvrE
LLLASLLLSLVWVDVQAARVKTWHHERPVDQDKAEIKFLVMSSEGTLRLSRRFRALTRIDATHVWSVIEDASGSLYAATGDEGKVYRIGADGKAVLVYTSESSQVLSLVTDAKAEAILAGTGPEATIVRIDSAGARKLCSLPESYVWALAADPRGDAFYAATGPNGRIYRVTSDGKASVFYETKQDHVLCLAIAADGSVYAGTDKTGRIYRIDPHGKGFVVYQSAQSEVRTLLLDDGVLFAGTSATKKRSGSGSREGSGSKSTARIESPTATRASTKIDKLATETTTPKSKETSKSSPATAPSTPSSGENSVYRIAPDGGVREVFRGKVLVLSLLRQGGRLLVGTGMQGELFEVDERTREKSVLARLDHGQLLSLCRRKNGSLIVGTGDPGKLYVLEDLYTSRGTIVSQVLDAKLSSRWGALRWKADTPEKTTVSIAVRSGNVAEPDETWSAWSEEQSRADEATVTAPPARYLQYRLTLKTDDGRVSPSVKSVTIRYATANQAPEVTKIEVPNLSATTQDNPKKLKLTWAAQDANEDELRYRLYVKKDGWERWVQLEADWDKTEYEWDTTTTPSGMYRLKVIASDHTDNPEKDSLSAERISSAFVVCHTPPTVTVKTAGTENGRMVIEATALSPLVRLTSASFTINGKKWVTVFPTDGLFDSKRETFRFRTEALAPGAYVVVLKVQDAAGNTGSADVVFNVTSDKPIATKTRP